MINYSEEEGRKRRDNLKYYLIFIEIISGIRVVSCALGNRKSDLLIYLTTKKFVENTLPNMILYLILQIIIKQEKKYKFLSNFYLPLSVLAFLVLFESFLEFRFVEDQFQKGLLLLVPLIFLFLFGIFIFRKISLVIGSQLLFLIYYSHLISNNSLTKFFSYLGHMSVALIIILAGIYYYLGEERINFELRRSLHNKEFLYRQFMNSMQESIIIISQEKGIIFQNESSKGFLQITSQDYSSQFRRITRKSGIQGNLMEDVGAALRDNNYPSYYDIEFKYKGVNLELKLLNITLLKTDYFEEKKTIGLIIKDVTERVRSQEQQIGEKYTTKILGSLSHEIRTPLNGIVGMLQIAKEKIRDPEIKGHLEIVESNSFFLHSQLNDILDFGHMNAKKFKLHNAYFSIRGLFHQLTNSLKALIPPRNVRVKVEISDKVKEKIYGDEGRISQIFSNFLSNALKYTTAGEIKLICRYRSDINIQLGVSDTGKGMSSARTSSLFKMQLCEHEEFRSLSFNEPSSGNSSLIGMGLTIAQMIATEMGTRICVKSVKGIGSNFFFGLATRMQKRPRLISEDANINPDYLYYPPYTSRNQIPQFTTRSNNYNSNTERIIPSLPISLPAKKIIIVDDNSTNRFVLRGLLREFKEIIMFEEADNGEVAVNIVRRELPHMQNILVFMDLDMPVMDGFAATARIREIDTQRKVNIVIVSAFTDEKHRINAQKVGAIDFYYKPVRKDSIKKVVVRYLIEGSE